MPRVSLLAHKCFLFCRRHSASSLCKHYPILLYLGLPYIIRTPFLRLVLYLTSLRKPLGLISGTGRLKSPGGIGPGYSTCTKTIPGDLLMSCLRYFLTGIEKQSARFGISLNCSTWHLALVGPLALSGQRPPKLISGTGRQSTPFGIGQGCSTLTRPLQGQYPMCTRKGSPQTNGCLYSRTKF